jgi:amidophosphoribosyltransferase
MCGFVGLISNTPAAPGIHLALQALQHRGQDSAGITTMSSDGGEFFMERGLGSVPQAVDSAHLKALPGNVGLGHVRYPTIGKGVLADTQPFFYRQPGVLMAHNGNITNYEELRQSLLKRSIHLLSHCDVEPALCEFADALMQRRQADHTTEDAMQAAREVRKRVRGSYSIVITMMLDGVPSMLAFRDPNGIRPMTLGRRSDGAWMVASESVAMDVLGFERVDEPAPSQLVILRAGKEAERLPLEAKKRAPCVFEHIYFARPDSVIDGTTVYQSRLDLGRALATRTREKGIEADVVIPVPDTSRPAATAMAEELSLPLREGLIKNRYSGRTFIMPDVLTRVSALRLKLNPLPNEIRGKKILLVDDSIVRGATLQRVVALMRESGAGEVHLAIHSPPVRNPCYYGIDMSTEEELFARRFGDCDLIDLEKQAAESLGADSLTWLDLPRMNEVVGSERCAACFDGDYPQKLPEADRLLIATDRKPTS